MRPRLLLIVSTIVFLLVVGLGLYALHHAYGQDDFWSVALPGVIVGCGTVATALVAVYFGVRAYTEDAARRADERARQRRQVFGLLRRDESGRPIVVEVVNGSDEAITYLIIEVHLNTDDDDSVAEWTFDDDEGGTRRPTHPYLLADGRAPFTGSFDTSNKARFEEVVQDLNNLRVSVFWIDSYGMAWARAGTHEPFPSTVHRPFQGAKSDAEQRAQPPLPRSLLRRA